MNKWEKVRFENLYISPSRNGIYKSSDFHGSGIKIVNMGEIFAYDFIRNQEMQRIALNKEEYDRFGLQNGDLLFARRSLVESGAGKSSIVVDLSEPTTFESSIIRVRLDSNKCVPLFYHYWMRSFAGKTAINALVTGTNVKGIRGTALKDIIVDYPDFTVQEHLSSILRAYDDLIENNQKQIKLLEEAAQRLYKEWFVDLRFPGHEETPIVDGVPAGWERKSIEDIADYLNGYAFKPSDWGKSGKPIIKIKELNEGITQDTPRNSGENIPVKYIVYPGEIIFSWSATLTAKIWDGEIGLLNQHLFKVTPYKGIAREFVLQSILWSLDEFHNLTTGSTMKHIQRGKLKQVFVNMPNEKLMKEFGKQTDFCRKKILLLNHKIQLLQESRDRLLPKLMSGEIEV